MEINLNQNLNDQLKIDISQSNLEATNSIEAFNKNLNKIIPFIEVLVIVYSLLAMSYINYEIFYIWYSYIIENEIKYALEKIKGCPVNESPYSYIRGFITKCHFKYSDFNFVKEKCNCHKSGYEYYQ